MVKYNESQALKASRRKHLAQIFRHEHLINEEKVFGGAIWRRVDRKVGYTRANVSTLARDIGIKWARAQRHLAHLCELGFFEVKRHGDHDVIRPLPIFDGHSPVMAYGSPEFERAARKWLDEVVTNLNLTVAQRVAAYGYVALTDPVLGTCDASPDDIAACVGVHPNTARATRDALIDCGRLQVKARHRYGMVLELLSDTYAGTNNQTHNEPYNESNKGWRNSPEISKPISANGCADLSVLVDLPTSTKSARAGAQATRISVLDDCDFDEICDVIEELGEPALMTKVVSLMSWRFERSIGSDCSIAVLCALMKCGHLLRVDNNGYANASGKYVTITDAGHAARYGNFRQAA